MFKQCINMPKGAKQVTLPKNENVVVFTATFAYEAENITPVLEIFRTGNRRTTNAEGKEVKKNLLADAKVIASSGLHLHKVKDKTHAAFMNLKFIKNILS